jgi:hypothetical protein
MILEQQDQNQMAKQLIRAMAGFILVKIALTYVIHRAAKAAR